jgi:beta-lactamase class D
MIYDRERINTGFVPASTSKIIHSLIFLDSGAVRDENEIIKWDGVKRFSPDWNKDQSLRSAFQVSAAWFYVEASKRLGRERMQKYYDSVGYGNRKTDGFGEAYWVKGDLRVTPREQVELLVRLYENNLPFSQKSIELVKNIMIAEKTDRYVLRAKTGWSDAYTPQIGWWIGYVEREQNAYFFALEMDMKNFADAEKRKTVTKNILKSLNIIE